MIMARVPDALLGLLDKLAAETAESRSAALRIALRAGLAALGIRSGE